MTHKIINTGDYLLIVDESDIKENNYVYVEGHVKPQMCKGFENNGDVLCYNNLPYLKEKTKKVISHLPLNNSPILEGVDLLPPLEDEVEKKLNENCNPKISAIMIKGYNKAKEKYKYTEEDLKDIWKYVKNNRVTYEEYLQSLQQPKMPVGFKCEIEKPSSSFGAHMANFFGQSIPKTTTNSQGLTQLVGEYIY